MYFQICVIVPFKIGYTSITIVNECENALLPPVRRFLLSQHYKFLP